MTDGSAKQHVLGAMMRWNPHAFSLAKYFVAGHVGGVAGVVVGQPFDTVKVRSQTSGVAGSAGAFIRSEGLRGLYRGLAAPVVAVGVQKAVAFGVFGNTKKYLQAEKAEASVSDVLLAGVAGGVVNSLLVCPIDQFKISMQIQDSSHAKLSDTIRMMAKNHGSLFRAAYNPLPMVVVREVVGYGLYFSAFEALTIGFKRLDSGISDSTGRFLMGGLTGMIVWSAYYPLDTIKSRMQAANARFVAPRSVPASARATPLRQPHTSILDALVALRASGRGARPFYRGLQPAVLRAFPTHAAVFSVNGWVLRWLTENDDAAAGGD